MSAPLPNHRERLLDLSTASVVSKPHLMELSDPDSTPPPPGEPDSLAPSTEAETAEANRIAQEVANME